MFFPDLLKSRLNPNTIYCTQTRANFKGIFQKFSKKVKKQKKIKKFLE